MYAYCRSVFTRHLRDPYRVDRHLWPGKRAPSAQNGLRIMVYGVDLHSKYKPGLRDQESYHTILDISFDTRYLYIAQVSSDWSLIHSIFDISKYRDTTKYRYRTFTSIAILRYIEYRTSTSVLVSVWIGYLCVCWFVCLFVCWYICVFVCLLVYLFVCLLVRLLI